MLSVLHKLLPPSILSDGAETATHLWHAVLTRTNFIPGVRHRLGWRGMRECAAGPAGFTLRVEDMPGVYGVMPVELHNENRQSFVELLLCYFPAPTEELLEAFSIQAGIVAQQPDYLDQVREFTCHDPLRLLFQVGRMKIYFAASGDRIGMSLEALTQHRLFATDGVQVSTPQGSLEAVPPGGIDQDLPAFATAMPFLRAFAASFSYCLESAPTALERCSSPGWSTHYDRNGQFRREPWEEARNVRLSLGWGTGGLLGGGPKDSARPELAWSAPAERPTEYALEPWWNPAIPGAFHSLDKAAMGIREKPRLIVLTGFLGAGKTSFLSRFIEYQTSRNSFVAVVQNEIGAKGLDGRLLGQNYALVEVDEGCVCCTLAGSLKLALGEILTNFQPDFVVLETTGVANPVNLLQELQELEDRLEFASVTTLIDAARASETLERHPVARSQLLLADAIIVNKTDLVAPKQLAELKKSIRSINATAPIHETRWGDISPSLLYGVNFRRQVQPPALPPGHSDHTHTHGEEGLSSLVVSVPAPVDRADFFRALEGVLPNLLRIKGVIEFRDHPGPQVYQYVPGFHTVEPAGEADVDGGFLVFIGWQLDAVEAVFRRLLNTTAPANRWMGPRANASAS